MYAIIDKRAPSEVKRNLEKYTDAIFEFSSEGITYDAISGHPDIFMFQDAEGIIIAPNTPKKLVNFLEEKSIDFSIGTKPVRKSLDCSVLYNCLSTEKYFFCKKGKPDISIQSKCSNKIPIHIPQSYARCSMFVLENKIITSDKGIVKVLDHTKLDYYYFDPSAITIKAHKHGFIGGTMGATDTQVFFLGNLLQHKNGEALHKILTAMGKEVICLGDDYLYDGGGLFFVG